MSGWSALLNLGGFLAGAALAGITVSGVLGARSGEEEAGAIRALRALRGADAAARAALSGLRRDGYIFAVVESGEGRWSAAAVPERCYDQRAFFVDETGAIRWCHTLHGEPATVEDGEIGG